MGSDGVGEGVLTFMLWSFLEQRCSMARHGIWWHEGEMLDATLRSLSSWSKMLHVSSWDMVDQKNSVFFLQATGCLPYKEAFG